MYIFGQLQIMEQENLIGSWQNGKWRQGEGGRGHPQSEVKAPEHVSNHWKFLAPSKIVPAYRCRALVKMNFIIFIDSINMFDH